MRTGPRIASGCMFALLFLAGCGASDRLTVTQRVDFGESLPFQRQFAMPHIRWYYAEDEGGNGVGIGSWNGLPLPGYKPTPGVGVTILPERAAVVVWTRREESGTVKPEGFALLYGPAAYLTTRGEGMRVERLGADAMRIRFDLAQVEGRCPQWQTLGTDCDIRGEAKVPSPPPESVPNVFTGAKYTPGDDFLMDALGRMQGAIKQAGLDPFASRQTLKYPLSREARMLLFAANLRKALEKTVPRHDWRKATAEKAAGRGQ